MELYKKYRPQTLNELIGNYNIKTSLTSMLEKKESFPHCILLTGSAGTGKTTIGRIIKTELECNDFDFHEMNISNTRGIDDAREIIKKAHFKPAKGKVRIFLLDEVHRATKEFHDCLLKVLEDTPKQCYFILATTELQKLPTTIRSRCTHLETEELTVKEMSRDVLYPVCKKEGIKAPKEVLLQIARDSLGSSRSALVVLNSISNVKQSQMLSIAKKNAEKQSETLELCRQLKDGDWQTVRKILKSLIDQKIEPETIRRAVLGYYSNYALSSGADFTVNILENFQDNYFDSGKAGLIISCYKSIK